jgi:hypothetical protein
MRKHSGRSRGFKVVFAAVVAVGCLAFAAVALANNLDRRTAQNVAKEAAKRECQATSNCTGYGASNVRLVNHHLAVGKIYVNSTKNGERFQCRQQVAVHLDPVSGELRYGLAHRKCKDLGPAKL